MREKGSKKWYVHWEVTANAGYPIFVVHSTWSRLPPFGICLPTTLSEGEMYKVHLWLTRRAQPWGWYMAGAKQSMWINRTCGKIWFWDTWRWQPDGHSRQVGRVQSVRRVSTVDGQGLGHWKGEGGTLQAVWVAWEKGQEMKIHMEPWPVFLRG